MIEFRGYITGAAEKRLWQKARKFGLSIIFPSLTFILPFIAAFAAASGHWIILYAYLSTYIWIPALAFLPKTKKERLDLLPQRIYTEDEYIYCITNKPKEYKKISDCQKLIDHGEFYELVYTRKVGRNDSFICQKNLLVSGSLKAFERLFDPNIIVRKEKK